MDRTYTATLSVEDAAFMKIPFARLDAEERGRLAAASLWLALAIWLVYLGVAAVSAGWGIDMRHFWDAARTLYDGGDPYVAIRQYPGPTLASGEQFHPLPWVALLFVPLAMFPYEITVRIWGTINWLLIVLSVVYVYRLTRERLPRWSVPLLGMASVLVEIRCLQAAQLGILVSAGILIGMTLLRANQPFRADLWFSVSMFKPWIAAGAIAALLAVAFRRRQLGALAGLILASLRIFIATSLFWPTWFHTYPHVDFSQALGLKVDGQYIERWPVATIFDYTEYILGWHLSPLLVAAEAASIAVAAGVLLFATFRKWAAGVVDDELFVGVASLLTLIVSPYVRYVDYPILTFWWIGVIPFVSSSRAIDRRWRLVITLMSLMALFFFLGTHLEPWVYQVPLSLYVATVALHLALRSGSPSDRILADPQFNGA